LLLLLLLLLLLRVEAQHNMNTTSTVQDRMQGKQDNSDWAGSVTGNKPTHVRYAEKNTAPATAAEHEARQHHVC